MSTTQTHDFRARLESQAADSFKRNAAEHVVKQLHRDGDIARVWRCGKPDSSSFMFYVCATPNCLMVYGDMGECMWQRHYDMVPFVRGSAHSLDYFSEKVCRSIRIEEHHEELIEEWFANIERETKEYGAEWTEAHTEAVQNIREAYDSYGLKEDFEKELHESILFNDFEDIPKTKYYTFHYLWIVEGLKWWIQKVDAGEVVPFTPADA